jgi:hypothetical protein
MDSCRSRLDVVSGQLLRMRVSMALVQRDARSRVSPDSAQGSCLFGDVFVRRVEPLLAAGKVRCAGGFEGPEVPRRRCGRELSGSRPGGRSRGLRETRNAKVKRSVRRMRDVQGVGDGFVSR